MSDPRTEDVVRDFKADAAHAAIDNLVAEIEYLRREMKRRLDASAERVQLDGARLNEAMQALERVESECGCAGSYKTGHEPRCVGLIARYTLVSLKGLKEAECECASVSGTGGWHLSSCPRHVENGRT